MSDKDPPPFGYTFTADLFGSGGAPTPLDAHGQSLLSDVEGQSLADFFSNTDPFSLADPAYHHADAKFAGNDFSDWDFMAPPTVHQVSATIPDQGHLHAHDALSSALSHSTLSHGTLSHGTLSHGTLSHGTTHPHPHPHSHSHPNPHAFHPDALFATPDDLQAASTLFTHASQPAYAPNPTPSPSRRMVSTSQGLLPEQLAALLPNHGAAGSLDAQLAAQWARSDAAHRISEDFPPAAHRPSLKRTYTFGTDDSFSNPARFSAPHNESEEEVTRRLMRDTRTLSYIGDVHAPELAGPTDDASDDDDSDETSSADDSQPSKKRKKSVRVKKESLRRTAPGTRVHKAKQSASSGDSDSKKKRATAAASKLARENLSEEQKRSNHILSEQKRRNLIKRGFDDLHDLVPEIRNGGLSKSSVLTEAANFLDKLIADNRELMTMVK